MAGRVQLEPSEGIAPDVTRDSRVSPRVDVKPPQETAPRALGHDPIGTISEMSEMPFNARGADARVRRTTHTSEPAGSRDQP